MFARVLHTYKGDEMKKATTQTLYYEHSANNAITMQVRPGEWFQVETQMNRGPDANLVPDDIRDLYNQYRSDNQPIDKGNASSGCIYVEGAKSGDLLTVHIRDIEVHPVGWTRYGGSTGAMPGYLGASNIGPQFRVCRIENNEIIWNNKLRFPVEPMLGVVGVAPSREARHNGWAGEWGGNFEIQKILQLMDLQMKFELWLHYLHLVMKILILENLTQIHLVFFLCIRGICCLFLFIKCYAFCFISTL
mgnify:CR=1 FL=1